MTHYTKLKIPIKFTDKINRDQIIKSLRISDITNSVVNLDKMKLLSKYYCHYHPRRKL